MKDYVKPAVQISDGLSEGVYAASGAASEEKRIDIIAINDRNPWTGGGNYRRQVAWTPVPYRQCGTVILEFTFDCNATYFPVWSNESAIKGDGTTVVQVQLQNAGYGGCTDFNWTLENAGGSLLSVVGWEV